MLLSVFTVFRMSRQFAQFFLEKELASRKVEFEVVGKGGAGQSDDASPDIMGMCERLFNAESKQKTKPVFHKFDGSKTRYTDFEAFFADAVGTALQHDCLKDKFKLIMAEAKVRDAIDLGCRFGLGVTLKRILDCALTNPNKECEKYLVETIVKYQPEFREGWLKSPKDKLSIDKLFEADVAVLQSTSLIRR